MTRGIFPKTGVVFAIPEFHQGAILGLISAVQAVVGLAFLAGRTWMYRALPAAVFGLFGLAGLTLMGWAGRSVGAYYAGAACLGVYSGCVFYCLVFYALAHRSRSAHYVAINESIVGIAGFIGPIAGGLLMDVYMTRSGAPRLSGPLASWLGRYVQLQSVPYFAAIGLVVGATVCQVMVHRRNAVLVRARLGEQGQG